MKIASEQEGEKSRNQPIHLCLLLPLIQWFLLNRSDWFDVDGQQTGQACVETDHVVHLSRGAYCLLLPLTRFDSRNFPLLLFLNVL